MQMGKICARIARRTKKRKLNKLKYICRKTKQVVEKQQGYSSSRGLGDRFDLISTSAVTRQPKLSIPPPSLHVSVVFKSLATLSFIPVAVIHDATFARTEKKRKSDEMGKKKKKKKKENEV